MMGGVQNKDKCAKVAGILDVWFWRVEEGVDIEERDHEGQRQVRVVRAQVLEGH